MSHPFDTSRLASADVDVKRWINETLHQASVANASVSTDTHVGQLLTRLQLHQQETATTLEDIISQSVVRLPRVAMEVERMGKDARDLSERLSDTAKRAQEIVQSAPPDAERLRQLRRAKEKLIRCAKVLQKAKMLGLQLDELEAAASSRGGFGAKSGGGDDMESITTSVAEVHESLREVQTVDPSFGTAMEARLRTLEAELQHNVERDCLDLMKRQDTKRAPKLLAALRKIHRDEHVFQQYLSHIVQSRKPHILQDLKSVTAANGANSGDLSIAFSQHYRNFEKIFSKEADYIRTLYSVQHRDPSAKDGLAPAVDSAECADAVKALTEAIGAISNESVGGILSSVSNEALVSCYALLPAASDSKSVGMICRKPYESIVTNFTQRETKDIMAAMHDGSTPNAFNHGILFIVASLQRCTVFFPERTLMPVVRSATDAIKQSLRVITNFDDRGSIAASSSSSTPSTQVAFQQYNECGTAMRSLNLLTDAATGALIQASQVHSTLADQLLGAKEEIIALEKECRARCLSAVCATMILPFRKILKEYTQFHLWAPQKASGSSGPKVAKSLAAFNAGEVAPTDLIRTFGSELMELPMTLESVEGDLSSDDANGDVVQFWIGRVVGDVVAMSIEDIRTLVIHPSLPTHGTVGEKDAVPTVVPALEQLICDLEYLSNVLAAVSEASFESTLGVAIQKIQDELERVKSQAGLCVEPCSLSRIL